MDGECKVIMKMPLLSSAYLEHLPLSHLPTLSRTSHLLSPGNPDPDGETLEAVRRHLDAERTQEQQAASKAETLGARRRRSSTQGQPLTKGLFLGTIYRHRTGLKA